MNKSPEMVDELCATLQGTVGSQCVQYKNSNRHVQKGLGVNAGIQAISFGDFAVLST